MSIMAVVRGCRVDDDRYERVSFPIRQSSVDDPHDGKHHKLVYCEGSREMLLPLSCSCLWSSGAIVTSHMQRWCW